MAAIESLRNETVLEKIKADFIAISRASNAKPKMSLFLKIMILDPGFQLVLSIRMQEALKHIPLAGKLLRRALNYATSIAFGSQIGTGASIGGGLYLPHPWGIVIGHGVIIGKNAVIFQQVTLGRGDYLKDEYPQLSDGVVLYAGAKAFGRVVIGSNSVVGSNAVVVKDVPSFCIAAGVPAKVIRQLSQH